VKTFANIYIRFIFASIYNSVALHNEQQFHQTKNKKITTKI